MNVGKTLFAQMMEFILWTRFSHIMQPQKGNLGVRRLNLQMEKRHASNWGERLGQI